MASYGKLREKFTDSWLIFRVHTRLAKQPTPSVSVGVGQTLQASWPTVSWKPT